MTLYTENSWAYARNQLVQPFQLPMAYSWPHCSLAQAQDYELPTNVPNLATLLHLTVRRNLDAFQYVVKTGAGTIQQLHNFPASYRKKFAQEGPFIDVFLGDTRLHKRVSKTLLYLFAPDVCRYLEPRYGKIVVKLPEGRTNALSMKLAVLYMEQACNYTDYHTLPWKALGDITLYIGLAEAFKLLGMMEQTEGVRSAIFERMQVAPLRTRQVRAIWDRENQWYPSNYAKMMAANVVTYSYSWMSPVSDIIRDGRMNAQQIVQRGGRLADRFELEQYLDDPFSIVLKQLVWNSLPLAPVKEIRPALYIHIERFLQRSHIPQVRPTDMKRLRVAENFRTTVIEENASHVPT